MKSLKIFDFDDTLANADIPIYVKMKNGKTVKLTSHEFAKYNLDKGDFFDFSEFNKLIKSATPIKKNVNLLKKALANPQNQVTILTARSLAYPVKYWLKTMAGVDVYVVAVGGPDPKLKADYIEKKIKSGYTDIYFIDDSIKNINAINQLKDKYPEINIETELAEKESIQEDLRKWLKQRWVDISRKKKGGGHPPCGASAGSKSRAGGKRAYPKCVPASKAASMSKKEKASAVRRKRSQYKGKGTPSKKAIHVKTKVNEEGKKDACYHKVKSRYKVWPSAYGSLALSKCRKVGAANWGTKSETTKTEIDMEQENLLKELIKNMIREEMYGYAQPMYMDDEDEMDYDDSADWDYNAYYDDLEDEEDWDEEESDEEDCGCEDEVDDHEGSMAKSDLASLSQLAAELNDMIDTDDELEGWVQAKITKAADYIEAVHKYMKYDY